MSRHLNRRNILKSLAAAAVAAPLVPLMQRRAHANTNQHPQRLVVFFHECGTLIDEWRPSGTGNNMTLTGNVDPSIALLGPLLPHQSKLNVISGLHNPAAELALGHSGHGSSKIGLLTGEAAYGSPDSSNWSNGPSVDQVIAERIGPVTTKRSIDTVVGPNSGTSDSIISFSGPNVPVNSRINDPAALHMALFGNFGNNDDAGAKALTERRLRVLKAAQHNFSQHRQLLYGEDKKRLDEHSGYLAELAKRLKAGGQPGQACSPPNAPAPIDFLWELDTAGRQMAEQTAMALACDISRIATINVSTTEHPQFPWTNTNVPQSDFHTFMHNTSVSASPEALSTKRAILRWHMSQFAHLLTAMDNIPEGDGTLLDHSLVLCISDHGDAGAHHWWDLPVILAGGACGQLETGRHLNFEGRTNNDLLVSILNLFGYDDASFGRNEFNNGALAL